MAAKGPAPTMPRLYRAAPGCGFPPSHKKKDIARHLLRKGRCPCKDVGWTAMRALDPTSVTRQTATSRGDQPPALSPPPPAPTTQAPPLLHALTAADGRPVVELRTSDGYVNATRMCQAAGKMWSSFSRLESTRAFLHALSSDVLIHTSAAGFFGLDGTRASTDVLPSLLEVHNGGHEGTWVHPKLAIKLAAWCSPQFELAVTDLVIRYSRGEVTAEESQQVAAGLQAATVPTAPPTQTLERPTGLTDVSVRRGVYIGRPSGEWSQLTTPGQVPVALPEGAAVLKFGSSEYCARRVKEHQNGYKGFEVWGWQPADDYRLSESSFRQRLQMDNRLVQGVNSNRPTGRDTELVVVRSEAEFMEIHQLMSGYAAVAPASLAMEEIKLKQMELTEPTRRLELTEPTRRLELEFQILRYRVEHGLPVT